MKTGLAAALVATLGIGTALAQQPSLGNEASIVRADSQPATPGSPDFFTGSVTVINRLKTLKRAMYGRAGFSLLRARLLHAA